MLTATQVKILNLMYELEETVGDIYDLFAANFPEYIDLWNLLSKEEKEHAAAVRSFYHLTYEGKASFDEGVIKPEGVQSIVEHLKMTYQSARKGEFTAEQALFIASDIEKSLLERDIFNHFNVSYEFADMLRHLQEGCQKHLQFVNAELDKIRKASTLL